MERREWWQVEFFWSEINSWWPAWGGTLYKFPSKEKAAEFRRAQLALRPKLSVRLVRVTEEVVPVEGET